MSQKRKNPNPHAVGQKKFEDRRVPRQLVTDPTVRTLTFEDIPCRFGNCWNYVVAGYDDQKKIKTRTLYHVPLTASIQPRAEGVVYLVRDTNHVVPMTESGFSAVEVEILGEVPTIGKPVTVDFRWDVRGHNGKSHWQAILRDGRAMTVLSPEIEDEPELGAKVVTNQPKWEVIPRRLVYTSPDGTLRIMKVQLVKQIFASPRAAHRHGGEQSPAKPSETAKPQLQKPPVTQVRQQPKPAKPTSPLDVPGLSLIADMMAPREQIVRRPSADMVVMPEAVGVGA